MISSDILVVFVSLFIVFIGLGFYGKYWRRGDLNHVHEWSLAGRKLGTTLVFFLIGADLYTAYSFVAIPSGVFAKGSLYFFAIPYVMLTFAVALVAMPRLWTLAKEKGYITASDFVKDRFSSRTLAIMIAITGIVAELPYIALQIVGMQAVLTVMLAGYANAQIVQEISLLVAFVILAAFTYTSGLRGATLTAIFKDILVWITVIAVIVIVPISIGGFGNAFKAASSSYVTLPENLVPAYATLILGSALALYLYPHAISGVLSAQSAQKLRSSTALLPLYGIGLAILALMGILVYAVPGAMHFLSGFPESSRGILVVPSLILYSLPSWFSGVALLGVFVGGLVPAAIMAMAQANLLTRNIIKEIKPNLSDKSEIRITKAASTIFKFVALGFVFSVPATYAISLQLLGGILIAQILPAVFCGLYVKSLRKTPLIIGLLAGIISGILMVEFTNSFGQLTSSLLKTTFGPIYIAVIALGINLVISFGGSMIQKKIDVKKDSVQ
ncbi:Na+/solute symporter [Nitrosotalea devaniterrae]|uniref:Na+/solute symporter n=1 Tax=Nitrosotalea devaniterrae TaxID=1078905 RepID=A0A128A423_9ARCH|nr:Na+/solute symporter [Candidatus Nitrosotalea devanaterra]